MASRPPPATPVPQPAHPPPMLATSSIPSARPAPPPPMVTTSSTPSAQPPPPTSDLAISSPSYVIARRPEFGSKGIKYMVKANHFLVSLVEKELYIYDVTITPEILLSKELRREIINELVTFLKMLNLDILTAYDGMYILYTAGKLPFTYKKFDKIKVASHCGDREYDMAIKWRGVATMPYLQQFLDENQHNAQNTFHVLDVVLREFGSINYVPVSRAFFSPLFDDMVPMDSGIDLWRGYHQSLRPTQMGLSLNTDVCAKTFYKNLYVDDFARRHLGIEDPNRDLNERELDQLNKCLLGVMIEFEHKRSSRYKIKGLSSFPLREERFDKDGVTHYITDYFLKKYKVNLCHLAYPCLNCGSPNRPIYLPMEVCKIVEGQRYIGRLTQNQRTKIREVACQHASFREKRISKMVQKNNTEDTHVVEFGMTISNDMTLVEGRVLTPPTLKYHVFGEENSCVPQDGVWSMKRKMMVDGMKIKSWACINFSNIELCPVGNFCSDLFEMCRTMGMEVKRRSVIPIMQEYNPHTNVEAGLRKMFGLLVRKSLDMLIIVLPQDGGHRGPYAKIKKVCETELGIMSQCCLAKHVKKPCDQYLENVALKINAKVGGRNTVLEVAANIGIPRGSQPATIIFGADVTHPSPGNDTSSIAAVVASMDWPEVTKYMCLVSAQPPGEIINDLFSIDREEGGMVKELLIQFYQRTNGLKPKRIIFYRDGVGEGQFDLVLDNELDAIKKACTLLDTNYKPRITFIIVQKRHRTRLFPVGTATKGTNDNVLPGTIVDTQICHPLGFDFYLCSHAAIKGTSRPAHYHVLYDENKFTADAIQELTNYLCYTYARCTRAVSIVPPIYYAHLAASRARCYVEREPTTGTHTRESVGDIIPLPKIMDKLKNTMFFV